MRVEGWEWDVEDGAQTLQDLPQRDEDLELDAELHEAADDGQEDVLFLALLLIVGGDGIVEPLSDGLLCGLLRGFLEPTL